MAFVLNDRVKETTTSTGTGTINLGGAATGFETFVAGIGNSNTTYYCIVATGTGNFEVGIGTVTDATPDTLSRSTVLSSSNSDSLVNFGSGTKDVFCTLPASKAVVEDASNNVAIGNNITLGGTVDGRDLQTDGTKLDGIEASADVTDSANVGTALTGFPTGTDAAASDLVPYYDVSASAWEKSTVTNLALQGPTGPTGAQGSTGPTGSTGSATLTNISNNRVMTAVSGTTLNGESNFTFDGTSASISGHLSVNGGSGNKSNDATVYITATDNSDWGLRVDKYNGSASDYGVQIDVGSGAGYASVSYTHLTLPTNREV